MQAERRPLLLRPQPDGLDEYVDWATDSICNHEAGRYQCRMMWLLPSAWIVTTMHIYGFAFVTTEPDIGAPSGRVLKLDGRPACTTDEVLLYGEACPELSVYTCGPDGGSNKDLYRDKWEYRDPRHSAAAEFDLSVCSAGARSWIVTTSSSLFWVGIGLGVLSGGFVSDVKGRRFTWLLYLTTLLVGSLLFTTSPNYQVWSLGRFVGAIGGGGFGGVGFTWASESINKESMHLMTWIPSVFFVTGACLVAPMASWVPDWRAYSWVLTAGLLPLYLHPFFAFESPKWLAAQGKSDEVHAVMSAIAAINGERSPPAPFSAPVKGDDPLPDVAEGSSREDWRALGHPMVMPRLASLCLLWMSTSYAYYGLSLFEPPDVFANPILSWCFGFAMELPAYIAAGYMINSPAFGRRLTVGGGVALGGMMLGIAGLKGMAGIALAQSLDYIYYPARMCIAAAFGALYPWSSEAFPSSIRNSAMGLCSFMARVGVVMAPWVGRVEPFSFRMALFAFPAVLSGMVALAFLPETRGKPLPGSVKDLVGDTKCSKV